MVSLRQSLIPAVPVLFRADGSIHHAAQASYLAYMQQQPIGGVAVWAHTGRGLHLTADQRAEVLHEWRTALPGKSIVAGVGGAPQTATPEEYRSSAMKMAEQGAKGGVDAFLVYAPIPARNMPPQEAERFIAEYHRQLGTLGVPIILFYLYEAAGGISYSPALLEELAACEEVIGIKIATADSVMTFQEVAALFAEKFPEKLIITGEDRFFGYSLMCGAHAALVGMGTALTGLQAAMMDAFYHEEHGIPRATHTATARYAGLSFLQLSALVDQFGRATFGIPLQGYIQRMMWALVELSVISEDAAHDPWGPRLSSGDRDVVRRAVRRAMGIGDR